MGGAERSAAKNIFPSHMRIYIYRHTHTHTQIYTSLSQLPKMVVVVTKLVTVGGKRDEWRAQITFDPR